MDAWTRKRDASEAVGSNGGSMGGVGFGVADPPPPPHATNVADKPIAPDVGKSRWLVKVLVGTEALSSAMGRTSVVMRSFPDVVVGWAVMPSNFAAGYRTVPAPHMGAAEFNSTRSVYL